MKSLKWIGCIALAIVSSTAIAIIASPRILSVTDVPAILESITQIPSAEPTILNYFFTRRDTFPKQGLLDEVSVNHLISQMSYSSLYCQKMVERDSRRPGSSRWAHQSIPFDQPPQLWSQAIVDSQLDQYGQMFWQRSLTSEERADLQALVQALATDLPNTPDSGQLILASVCGLYGTSFSFLSL